MGTSSSNGWCVLPSWRAGGAAGMIFCLLAYYQLSLITTIASEPYELVGKVDDPRPANTVHDSRVTQHRRGSSPQPPGYKHKVVLVMSDNRDFRKADRKYLPWTVLLNLRYAAQYDYRLRYYHINDKEYWSPDIKNSNACHHPTEGWRGSPWCKLVALLHTLSEGYETAVFVDSDAFFSHLNVSVPQLLERYAPNATTTHTLFFGSDMPHAARINSGFIIVKNTPEARALITRWWNVNTTYHNHCHTFEQHAANTILENHPKWGPMMYNMKQLRPMNESEGPVIHIETYRDALRPGPMWKALVSQDFDAAFESVNSNDPPKWATEGHHLMDYLDYIEFNATAFALPYSTKAY